VATRERSAHRLKPVVDRRLAERIAQELREAIRDGTYLPGARLVERRLAEELHVSHIPIREALAELTKEGLVERLPRRGCRVAQMSEQELGELSSLRTVLESFVVERARTRIGDADAAALARIVEQMRVAASKQNTARIFDLDVQFHNSLWELSAHSSLQELVAQLRARINGFLRVATIALPPDELTAHAEAHAKLLEAILHGSDEEARAAVAEHIEQARGRIGATLHEEADRG
jgi:DNA-binding GntR family transcriptional regulator